MRLKNQAYFLLIGLFYIVSSPSCFSQDQRIADSLAIIYANNELKGVEKLELLRNLAFNERNSPQLALAYSEALILLSIEENSPIYLHRGHLQKGSKHILLGDVDAALNAFYKSAEAAIEAKYISGEANAYMSIADAFSVMENFDNAEEYYNQAIAQLRKTDDSIFLASAILNAGDAYLSNKQFAKALQYFEESGALFKKANYLVGTAYNLGNVGIVHAELGKHSLAEKNINEAIQILQAHEDFYPIAVYLTYMADIYVKQSDMETALNYAHRSLDLATEHGLKDQISDANLKLSELYELETNGPEALKFYKSHIQFRDSIYNLKNIENMADLQTDFKVSQKQIEVDLANQKKKTQKIIMFASIIAFLFIGFAAISLFKRNKFVKATNTVIAKEKQRSDKLLRNILPEEIAEELKSNGKVKAQKFDSVTVLFADFEGFTRYSEKLSPEVLVETIDYYFSEFDKIIEGYQLEKIKTIGDAYMCAGGLPYPSENHAKRMILAAIDIAAFVDRIQAEVDKENLNFNIRIGINTGPVVAGVVGYTKFAYDIWGDTVNIASRMESNSKLGKINISENTYQLIKDDFECEYRGEIAAKNRGMLKMYFVNAVKKSVTPPKMKVKSIS